MNIDTNEVVNNEFCGLKCNSCIMGSIISIIVVMMFTHNVLVHVCDYDLKFM